MFKKITWVLCLTVSSIALAELPSSLTPTRMASIIRGNGKLEGGQKHCKLERNFEEINPVNQVVIRQSPQDEILQFLNTEHPNIELDPETLTAESATYLLWSELPPRAFQITFNCA